LKIEEEDIALSARRRLSNNYVGSLN